LSTSAIISRKRIAFAYTAWWMFWILAHTFVMHRLDFNWRVSFTDAVISDLMLAVAGFVTGNALRFYQPGSANKVYRFVWGFVLALIYAAAVRFVLAYVFSGAPDYLMFLEKSMPLRFMFALLMLSLVILTGWLWFYIQDQQETKSRKDDAEKLLRDAELSRLRQQLQPHFLFNSLNSISALAGSQPGEARKMIQQLSDFLRGTLKKDDQQLVKLEEELEHLQLYLDIEKVRFGHRLNTVIEKSEESLVLTLPSLLLQPIVENAIKFGLYDTTEDVTIRITASREQSHLILEVQNPFDPETAQPKQGAGFGLNSIQRRLYLLYARNDLLTIRQKENLFSTRVKIPQSK
jgi:two-component system LytT family sensor kinase